MFHQEIINLELRKDTDSITLMYKIIKYIKVVFVTLHVNIRL